MTAADNKKLMQEIFSGLAQGDRALFLASLAEDFRWTITGTTAWSKTYNGRQAVLDDLVAPLRAKLGGPSRTVASRFIADDDIVVVEAHGHNTTKAGAPYNNRYCFVYRLAGGKLIELTEYLDTELVTAALGDPGT